ncbi:MAG: hypothetical protein RMI49_04465 [Candidatus Caldarchaeum sp.]|nr:hypothetical protein [Candidatus Caldarchaeum sp.]
MLGHQTRRTEKIVCRVCGKESDRAEAFHYITGFGYVCRQCALQPVICDVCGNRVRRMTVTVLRGKTLCLTCYRTEREKGDKRLMKELVAESIEEAVKASAANTPEGFVLVGVRLKPSSKQTWMAEYEREDIFISRCS